MSFQALPTTTSFPNCARRLHRSPGLKPGSNTVHIRNGCRLIRCDIDAVRPDAFPQPLHGAECSVPAASGPTSRCATARSAAATTDVAAGRNETDLGPRCSARDAGYEHAPPLDPRGMASPLRVLRNAADPAAARHSAAGIVRASSPSGEFAGHRRMRTGNRNGHSKRHDASRRSFTTEAEYALISLQL